jgi:hypothetical protein
MKERKNGPQLQKPSFKRSPLTAEQSRARRAGEAHAHSANRREALIRAARGISTPPSHDVAMTDVMHAPHATHATHAALSPMHGAPLVPQHSMTPPTPFAMPHASPSLHQPLLQSTHAPTPMEVDSPLSNAPHSGQASAALSPMASTSSHAPQPMPEQTPEQVLGSMVTPAGWAKFSARSATENRREAVGLPAAVHRPSPELSSFVYDQGGTKLEHQVKYGPGAHIDAASQTRINAHYGEDMKPRLSQYSSNRQHYVQAARDAGRPLTHQEFDVGRGVDPGPTSINHVIASGTGQNLLNQMTLQFNRGGADFAAATTPHDRLRGVAQQAAAVGRMTGIGRAILTEEAPQGPSARPLSDRPLGPGRAQRDAHLQARDAMAGNVRTAFQANTPGERAGGYKTYLKNTFDSFGNLRLGHATGNGRVSTGIDIPLTSTLSPTPRGERLYHANLNFGLTSMETPAKVQAAGSNYRSGFFTTSGGKKLSSSTEK